MSSRDINAIWAQLKANNTPSNQAAVASRPSPSPIASSDNSTPSKNNRTEPPSLPLKVSPLPPKPFDAHEARQALPRLISTLQDPTPSARRQALEQLAELLLPPSHANDGDSHAKDEQRSEFILEELEGGNKVGKALLRRFVDPSEAPLRPL